MMEELTSVLSSLSSRPRTRFYARTAACRSVIAVQYGFANNNIRRQNAVRRRLVRRVKYTKPFAARACGSEQLCSPACRRLDTV